MRITAERALSDRLAKALDNLASLARAAMMECESEWDIDGELAEARAALAEHQKARTA